ncbi:helix-turn-helix domain-containing protein [Natrinema salsiterrestre]|uniref:Helix-turn-helix domain-containing protein n=1 Tax=Natrinema salsiterrestre TaxID=2950540 RepID=A0A9Q4KXD2_9EURY|nr:helix-turn-helix domain-containing protein [Natrinema salsiterrestre]MDF9745045.1 helix-turn-helix domain-containing protein [Natrinema salsiterrestre]
MVVFEFAVPTEELALEQALTEYPDVIVEYERLVPTNDTPLPYLWTTDGQTPQFKQTVAADPKVDHLKKAATFNEGALYQIEWTNDGEQLLQWISSTHEDVALLQAEGHDDEWVLKLRFPSRSVLSEFREFADEQAIDLRVIRLYDLTDPKLGQYNITKKQREALIQALEMGHFEIPREATLEEVAASIDISQKALSERLRRGQTNLISNSLTVGQPTGVGVGEQ